jgi:hypothetical protein
MHDSRTEVRKEAAEVLAVTPRRISKRKRK